MKTGTGLAQCKNRLYEKVLRAQATPQTVSSAADPLAVAEAVKKADAAMEALLVTHLAISCIAQSMPATHPMHDV